MGYWAELQQDLLVLIAKRIGTYEDFLAFGGVCRSWRLVAVPDNFKGFERIPWLMLAEKDNTTSSSGDGDGDGDERRFVSLRKGGVIRKVMLTEARGKRCMESLGWFVTISKDGELNILHPFSRVHMELPHISTFNHYFYDEMINNFIFIQKAVFSSNPAETSDYVLMVIYGSSGWLGFWRPGDKTWTTIETHQGAFRDINYYKGKFYGVDTEGTIFECDVGGPNPTVANIVGGIPVHLVMYKRAYIVESAGAVLIVLRDGFDLEFVEGGGEGRFEFDNIDESRIYYETREFQVFEVDLRNGKWVERKSLGVNALFLGDNASISVEASKCPGIKANCIYYTDDCWEAYLCFKRGGGKNMGIYNLEDGSRSPCYRGESFSPICPPIWVNPPSF